MAPNGEMLVASKNNLEARRPRRMSMEGLQRAVSDLSFMLGKDAAVENAAALPAISEVEEAKCECCGVSEECTPEYIRRVRDKFGAGRWICGLCSEAVEEEMAKNGGRKKEAVEAHLAVCGRFRRIGRTQPVLLQAEAMREILRKSSSRAKSISPRNSSSNKDVKKGGQITRSTSCIPAITKEMMNK
ncbi:uncharacterized protein LOC121994356 [Zingiber officinale]|uniref:DUF1677 family protein n=1 Tax=Zingiber officinale TaxID=94328 RepID=A0A8J5GGS8_ZINOF|nr:uncharacterized protein LOC121994356 [Zingiber officinale]KAG6501238.1 hypothetical protein ZIOFF_041116 [Zingiber officinale]